MDIASELDRQIFSEAYRLYTKYKDRCSHPADYSPESEQAWSEIVTDMAAACDRCHMHPLAIELMEAVVDGLSRWASMAGTTGYKYNGVKR